jgi:hypothetical protein
MREARYYRDEAARARRWANSIDHPEVRAILLNVANDYDDIAVDIEKGAIEIRHAELMPQLDAGRRAGRREAD